MQPIGEQQLWQLLIQHQDGVYYTAKGLEFHYTVRGNEMFVDRRGKSITRATVQLAARRAMELGSEATGPKKLGCFGASYLYPVFVALEIIER